MKMPHFFFQIFIQRSIGQIHCRQAWADIKWNIGGNQLNGLIIDEIAIAEYRSPRRPARYSENGPLFQLQDRHSGEAPWYQVLILAQPYPGKNRSVFGSSPSLIFGICNKGSLAFSAVDDSFKFQFPQSLPHNGSADPVEFAQILLARDLITGQPGFLLHSVPLGYPSIGCNMEYDFQN